MIEDNNICVLRLCSVLDKIQQRELKVARAHYKVAYLKKIRSAIVGTNKSKRPPDGYAKWKDRPNELKTEIEKSRLELLKIRGDMLEYKKKIKKTLVKALDKAQAALAFQNGQMTGIMVGLPEDGRSFISSERFSELADQYEAITAMNKIFKA